MEVYYERWDDLYTCEIIKEPRDLIPNIKLIASIFRTLDCIKRWFI